MIFRKHLLNVAAAAALGLTSATSQAFLDFTSSGIWSAFTGSPNFSTGIGSSQLGWGPAAPGGSTDIDLISSYVFEGLTGSATVGGTLFPIGDFTHNNFTIRLPSIESADLQVTLDFDDGGAPMFGFIFDHLETPNNADPCANPPGGVSPCPDLVSIPSTTSTEAVIIGGVSYSLDIVGFSQDGGSTITESFTTLEDQVNTARLFGRLIERQTEVPAPATPMLIGFGLIALARMRERKKQR